MPMHFRLTLIQTHQRLKLVAHLGDRRRTVRFVMHHRKRFDFCLSESLYMYIVVFIFIHVHLYKIMQV